MLRSIKQLYGDKLAASDGDLGEVKDFHFDDQNWAVRYVVAETGIWLSSRQVLLSPHAFGKTYPDAKILPVKLTRKQIEDSPPLQAHKPVDRQFEEDYHRHYGWPNYWQGDVLWGTTGFPILESPARTTIPTIAPPTNPADTRLRSTQSVSGYHLQATDGIVGHVTDFMMDAHTWTIRQLVVKIGHRLSGREVQIPTGKIDRISYQESTVFVHLNGEAVEQSSAYPPVLAGEED